MTFTEAELAIAFDHFLVEGKMAPYAYADRFHAAYDELEAEEANLSTGSVIARAYARFLAE